MLVTLKLECAPEVSENAIFTAIQATILGKPTRDVLLLDKGEALVTVDIRAETTNRIDDLFPIHTSKCVISLITYWIYDTNASPSYVVLHDPPHGVTKENVEIYLEGKNILAKAVNESDEDNSITLQLLNPTDLPYLVTKTHMMRRTHVSFEEVHIAMDDNDENDVNQSLPVFANENNDEEDFYEAKEDLVAVSRVIKITGIVFDESLAKRTIEIRFQQDPYNLHVEQIIIEERVAYVIFAYEEEVDKVLVEPLKHLLGCPVECVSIKLEDVPGFKSTEPQVLVLKDLPSSKMSERLLKKSIEILFQSANCTVSNCIVRDNEAYVKFDDPKSISKVMENPPDHGTLLGYPIVYAVVDEKEMLQNDETDNGQQQSLVLVAENLPDLPDLDEALCVFMKSTTDIHSIKSCDVKEGKAYIEYSNPEDVSKVLRNPPTVPFLGKMMKFKTVPIGVPNNTSNTPRRAKSLSPDDLDITPQTSETVQAIPPPIKPRSSLLTDTIVVKKIPAGVIDVYLGLYIRKLSGIECQNIAMNGDVAVVKLASKTDVKQLQTKALQCPYPEGNTILVFESFRPSNCVCIAKSTDVPSYAIKLYCEQFGRVTDFKETEEECVVTYEDRQSHQRILHQSDHSLGSLGLVVSDYIPLLSQSSYSSSNPPPIPVRKDVYSWVAVKEHISSESQNYYLHIQKKMNDELFRIQGECHISRNLLEIKPFSDAAQIPDWDHQVHQIISRHKNRFVTATLPIEPNSVSKIIEYLSSIKETNPDLHFDFNGSKLLIAGHERTVANVTKTVNEKLNEEIEISFALEKPQRYTEYILKFADEEIKCVRPPVKIEKDSKTPGGVSIIGVQKSLEQVRKIVENKMKGIHEEVIYLNPFAYRLLYSRSGKARLNEKFKDIQESIVYVFEKTEQQQSEYGHQLSILSPISPTCAVAKRLASSLICEKKIPLSPERSTIIASPDWKKMVEKYTNEYFVHINVRGDVIVLTGEEKYLETIAEQIVTTIDVQHSVTNEIPVSGVKWQLLYEHQQAKLKAIQDDAKKMKVKLSLPPGKPDSGDVLITLRGDVRSVDNIKTKLEMLVSEIIVKEAIISPQVGLNNVMENKLVGLKIRDLQKEHSVLIKYNITESFTKQAHGHRGSFAAGIQRVINASSPSGLRVRVYTGDPNKKKCDALAVFVSERPDEDHPIMSSMATVGGSDVRNDIDLSLKSRQHLIPATIHRSSYVGQLSCSEIFYPILPCYDRRNFSNRAKRVVETAVSELFEKAVVSHNDIIITSFTGPPHNYPVEIYAECVLSALVNVGIYNDAIISIFIDKNDHKEVFQEKMKSLGYTRICDPSHPTTLQVHQSAAGLAINGINVHLLKGSITEVQCDGMVNSTSIDMRAESNTICKVIHKAAGKSLNKACQALRDKDQLLKNGVVLATESGDLKDLLKCRSVIHAHVPGKLKGAPPTQEQSNYMKKVISNCLKKAEEEHLVSLSMPAFCLGIGHYTVPESAKPTLDAIKEFAETTSVGLKEVHIIIFDNEMYKQFAEFYTQYMFDRGLTKMDSRKGDGIYATMGFSRNISHTDIPQQLQAPPKQFKVTFQIYGLNEQKLRIVDREVKGLIKEMVIDDMVDLGEVTNLINDADMNEINQVANRNDVEVKIQASLSRALVTGEERAVEKVCHHIQCMVLRLSQLLNGLHTYEWSAQQTDGFFESYNLECSQKLEIAYQRKSPIVELMIDGINCIVDLAKMEEKELTGVVTRTVTRSRKMHVEYPITWNTMDPKSNVEYFEVPLHSSEYHEATYRFFETLGSNKCNIIKVQRVQNPSEYTRYQSLKTSWRSQKPIERDLFHGSKKESISSICANGFNRGYAADANAARFGKGVYFALNASYSLQNKYSVPDKAGERHMLVCSLLTCHMTRGNEKMKVPPALPNNPEVLYDTLVENIDNPTIFVAMKDSQAYPKYWITFKT